MTTARDATRVCLSCGMCCDGTLFDRAPLKANEVEPARASVLKVLQTPDGGHALAQPCAALKTAGCSIYEQRPAACRRYECPLLRALADDEVTELEAIELVARVRTAADPQPLLKQYFRWQRR